MSITIAWRSSIGGERRPLNAAPAAAMAAIAALMTLLTSCSPTPSVARLRMAGGDAAREFGLLIVAPTPGARLSVGTMNLCIDSGTATVTGAHFKEGDVPLESFGVRVLYAADVGLGYLPGTLAEHGFPGARQPITVPCASSDQPNAQRAELGITIASDGAKILHAEDLVVTYTTNNGSGELTVPLRLLVCPPDQAAHCREPTKTSMASSHSAAVLVEADMFSGRPNPSWSLVGEQARDVVACLSAATVGDAPTASTEALGFRAFSLTGLPASLNFAHVDISRGSVIAATTEGKRSLKGCDQLFLLLRSTASSHLNADELSRIPNGK